MWCGNRRSPLYSANRVIKDLGIRWRSRAIEFRIARLGWWLSTWLLSMPVRGKCPTPFGTGMEHVVNACEASTSFVITCGIHLRGPFSRSSEPGISSWVWSVSNGESLCGSSPGTAKTGGSVEEWWSNSGKLSRPSDRARQLSLELAPSYKSKRSFSTSYVMFILAAIPIVPPFAAVAGFPSMGFVTISLPPSWA